MEPAPVRQRRYTVEDYFRMEAATDDLLEFYDGNIVVMSGGSINHSRIVNNVGGELRSRLRDTPCEAFDPGLRVRLNRRGQYVHPDVTVVCGPVEVDPDDPNGETVVNPRLIVEVLSPSTELHDRTRKAGGFRDVPSLAAYLLVAQDEPRVEPYYRNGDGVWSFGEAVTDAAATVRLPWVGVDLPMAEIYARVTFPPATAGEADGGTV